MSIANCRVFRVGLSPLSLREVDHVTQIYKLYKSLITFLLLLLNGHIIKRINPRTLPQHNLFKIDRFLRQQNKTL